MSLRGRYIIDRVHKAIGHRFRIPCPPYHEPTYWNEGVYRTLGPSDVYEWGNVSLLDLEHHTYRLVYDSTKESLARSDCGEDCDEKEIQSCTFRESLGLDEVESMSSKSKSERRENILLLGCGNSRLGEEMACSDQFTDSKIIQVDVSQNLISSMETRCSDFIQSGIMEFVEDDATSLSAFSNNSIKAIVDKGLVDALYCSKHPSAFSQISSVMQNVNRILETGGVFSFLSFSHPEFLLHSTKSDQLRWKSVEVRELPNIFMYRYIKKQGAGRSQALRRPMNSKQIRGDT